MATARTTPKRARAPEPHERKRAPQARAQATLQRIYTTALELFRTHGYDQSTMREIAKLAGSSLGSTYHHFASKEAIVLRFYEEQLARHETLAHAGLQSAVSLRDRLYAVFASSLDVRLQDQKLWAALAKTVLDPQSDVGLVSPHTAHIRERSTALFRQAIEVEGVPLEVRDLLANALWVAHLAMLFYFIQDTSPKLERTRALILESLDLLTPLVASAGLPAARLLLGQTQAMLSDAGIQFVRAKTTNACS